MLVTWLFIIIITGSFAFEIPPQTLISKRDVALFLESSENQTLKQTDIWCRRVS